MKKLSLITLSAAVLSMAVACTTSNNKGGGGSSNAGGTVSVWVGNEEGTAAFYQDKANEFIAAHEEYKNFKVQVTGSDLGSIAGTILKDASACADIYSVAHDNVGKLAQGSCARPFTDESLTAQIKADNSEAFVAVSSSKLNDKDYLFAAPYISQALFLMYDKRYVSDEQAKTFEGLKAAAVAASASLSKSVKAVECPGTDGFNFAFTLLAKNAATKTSSFKLYADGTTANGQTDVQGDDEVAIAKWIRDYRADANGFQFPTDAGWSLDIQNQNAISFIGGAWHYSSFVSAVGASNVGVGLIPTFTLGAGQGFGTISEGTTFRGGTFADCKVMMINSKTDKNKFAFEQDLVKYLTSQDTQNAAFKQCSIIPAYKTFADNMDKIEGVAQSALDLAAAQTGMSEYGMPQPFTSAKLNNYYYQMGAPAVYQAIVDNSKGAYNTDRKIQEALYKLQYIWQMGEDAPSVPDTLPDYNIRK